MSVDTRTPRPGFDDQPALSMVKVDCDPAQVIVNHASFRVQLAPANKPRSADPARVPAMSGAAGAGGAAARRRAPVVWSGKSSPGDPGATGLLQAVRESTALGTLDAGATQVIPRLDDTMPTPVVGAQRVGPDAPPLLPPMRRAVGAYDEQPDGHRPHGYADAYGTGHDLDRDDRDGLDRDGHDARADDRPADGAYTGPAHRHAYYPGRRMNLGVVLLPLRVFLGFISIYAGMGKLCDPVYFDGGERGSMVKWLNSLHPWALAEPLRDFALAHPVGAGLTVAFAQVIVGVLTVLGLWQRVAAVFGVMLSAALILTVSWKTVPVYDAPDIIYLAAWSPLIIAGAPVYSIDGRLAGEAWRTLGPRSALWDLRRRVLRRGVVVATVVVGLTLLIGSVLGGAVRSTEMVTVPGPNDDPTNHLPGRPLPEEPGERSPSARESTGSPEPSASASTGPTAEESASSPAETAEEEERVEEQRPTASQGTGQEAPEQSEPVPPPTSSAGPTSTGGGDGGDGGGSGGGGGDDSGSGGSGSGGGSGGGGSSGSGGGSSTGGNRNPIGGLLG
ncbi:DoxX family protein [Streptomyces ficellus]|uniref:DoxX family protein n=1 Tax=Streptomyces ficellus TaxID=1977088 RepID=A0A6I6FKU3_9ACTN|nr:DoxX family protein [Streptomyces ficellus]QGV79885.1 DoxX family protein [Streptomyces ficellus]